METMSFFGGAWRARPRLPGEQRMKSQDLDRFVAPVCFVFCALIRRSMSRKIGAGIGDPFAGAIHDSRQRLKI